jgi:hypothetical protein
VARLVHDRARTGEPANGFGQNLAWTAQLS